MLSKLLLQVLISGRTPGSARSKGYSMLMTVTVALALIVGGLALVEVSTGFLREAFASSDGRQARAAAEAGIDQIINTWNQPENRKMLVSGTAMTSWAGTTSGETLRSPCVRNNGTRPGNNDGQPTAEARSFGDGQFRDVGTGATNTGERRFRLTSLTYATGASGASDRRSLRRTTELGTGSIAAVGTPPSGASWDSLINLDDPDGSGSKIPGYNSGYITLVAEGQVVRNGTVVATATITRELQVLPKCCGGSFGSGGSGGANITTNSLGSDSRYCGVEFGIITGINGGRHWSFYANDRYTTRNSRNTVVNISSMLGVLNSGETKFDRSNCRVIPTPNAASCNPAQSSQDTTWGRQFNGASPAPGCQTTTNPPNGQQYGTTSDIAGTSISCIPIVPISFTLLPSVTNKYGYSWSAGGRPLARITTGNSGYPAFASSGPTYKIILRTRRDTNDLQICDATYVSCTDSAWGSISSRGSITIADDFSTGNYIGSSGSINRWPAAWSEVDPTTGGSPTTGSVAINSGALRLTGGSSAERSIKRPINLYGLSSPYLTFIYNRSTLSGTKNLIAEYSNNNGSAWSTLRTIPGDTGQTTLQSIPIPSAAQTPYTILRFRLGNTLSSSEWISIDNVSIGNTSGNPIPYDNWCEYSASAPVTSARGFLCLGPQLNMVAGGSFVIDTTGGPVTFYYNQLNDTRGSTQSSPSLGALPSASNPLIATDNGATVQHVKCPELSNSCTTPVSESVYAPVGEPDQLNFFGRDSGAVQYMNIGSLSNSSSSPGKISGAWFYFPMGNLTLTVDGCADGSQPADFYTNDNGWNFSGRIWVRDFKPCGAFHFRVPPSSLVNTASLFGTINTTGDVSFVAWSGVDWVARATTNARLF
jgi:hypothetical protein